MKLPGSTAMDTRALWESARKCSGSAQLHESSSTAMRGQHQGAVEARARRKNVFDIVSKFTQKGSLSLHCVHLYEQTMTQRSWLISVVVLLFLGGALVLMADAWVGVVRWVNCGPLASERSRNSEVCR